MRRKIAKLSALFLVIGAAAVGCSDRADIPTGLAAGAPSQTTSSTTETVEVLQRNTPIAQTRVSQTLTKSGGTLEIPGAGLKVIFPRDFLPLKGGETVTITVTAVAGDEIAYVFEPHGLVFQQPLKVSQDLKVTNAYKSSDLLSSLLGAYFPSLSSLDPAANTISVSEFRPSSVDVKNSKIDFTVDHFSGYAVVSGRSTK